MVNNFKINPTNQKIENVLPMYEDDGFDLNFSDLFKEQNVGEQIQKGLDRDYGNVDKKFSLYEKFVKNEPMQQEMYLNRLKDLNKQGGGRGGSKSDQLQMAGMDARYQTEKKEITDSKEKAEKAIADAKAKAEAKAAYDDSAKGRFEKFYNDDGKRNAVLNAISDTMLQTKYGKDVYGNRMNELPGNINRAIAQNEALDMVKTQAALDMQKTAAETDKLNNPLEWLSDKQKQARDIATAMGAEQGYEFGSPEWKEAYARELRQIAAPTLMSGSIDGIVGIKDILIKYGSTLDQETLDVMNGLVEVLQSQLPGNAAAPSQSYNTIKAKVKED